MLTDRKLGVAVWEADRLAHDYPDQPDLRFATLRAAVLAAQELVLAYRGWTDKLLPGAGV